MNMEDKLVKICRAARTASRDMATIGRRSKDEALANISRELLHKKSFILAANEKDVKAALKQKLGRAFIDRLTLNRRRVQDMSDSLIKLARLEDPVGALVKSWRPPSGILIKKVRVPLGVILVIYESRPNVTVDCVGLCLKSGNACILRGGREAINSNIALYRVISSALIKSAIPRGAVNIIETTERKAVGILLRQADYIDLAIPRGGEGLIKEVAANSKIPVLKHYKGLCHIYVDKAARLDMAVKIILNAKVQRPGVCNAVETLLVHKDIAKKFLPLMIARFKEHNVEMRGCDKTRAIARGIKRATEEDWQTEYLDLIISIKVVGSLDEAISHISKYSSGLSDAIVTQDEKARDEFLKKVDSACVYHNASTRFTDGGEFGFGAEIGISTDRLHARGPVGLEELATYKYAIYGNGQIRT